MFNFRNAVTKAKDLLKIGAISTVTDYDFIIKEINEFKSSKQRQWMIDGEKYYEGQHDILKRQRTVIGEGGKLEVVSNLPNNKIVDNQYAKMVDQKTNYLLGKPFVIQTENEAYSVLLEDMFNAKFKRLLKNVGVDFYNGGIGWLFPCYDEKGEFTFKRFSPKEIIAGWRDSEHTVLDYAIRIYEVIHYTSKTTEEIVEKVEVFDESGINYFELHDNKLVPVEPYHQNYFTIDDENYNWSKIPLIPFKYNNKEIPLIKKVKSLQDGLNIIESNFQNQMEEDVRNTIMVLVNYDGEDLGEFRRNLATYGAVKVRTVDGAGGDLKTLEIEVNCENYKTIIELFKKAIIDNARGFDAKDDRMSGNPNQMNIQAMYSDIDLDANGTETELQASFEELLWFIDMHFYNMGLGDYEKEKVDIIFNRDMLVNEGEIIENCGKSEGIISKETIIANHPWVDDPQAELERLEAEKQKDIEQYGGAFTPNNGGDVNNEDEQLLD